MNSKKLTDGLFIERNSLASIFLSSGKSITSDNRIAVIKNWENVLPYVSGIQPLNFGRWTLIW